MAERTEGGAKPPEHEPSYDPHVETARVIDQYGHWERKGVLHPRRAGAVFLGVKNAAFEDLPRIIQFALPMNHSDRRTHRQKNLIVGFSAAHLVDGDQQSSQVMISITKDRTANVLELTFNDEGKFLTDMHRVTPQLAWIDYSSTAEMLTKLDLRESIGRFKQKLDQMKKEKRSERSFRQAFRQHEAYFINFEEFLYQFYSNEEFARQVWARALEVLRLFPDSKDVVPGSRFNPDGKVRLFLPFFELTRRIAQDSVNSSQLPAVTKLAPIFLQGDSLTVYGKKGITAVGSTPPARRAS